VSEAFESPRIVIQSPVATTPDHLPEDTAALKAALIEVRAKLSGAEALIEHLQLVIGKMKREMFGPRSERSQRLIEQMESQLEELAAAAGEDDAPCSRSRPQAQLGGTFSDLLAAGCSTPGWPTKGKWRWPPSTGLMERE
jgi:hypothetical protein